MAANPWYQAIQDAALARVPAILSEWLPGGRINRNEYECASIQGGDGKSLKVSLTKGVWSDFAAGGKGNLIALFAEIRHIDYKEAARTLAEQFNIPRPTSLKLAPQVWEPMTPIPDWAPMTEEGLPDVPARQDGTEVRGAWCYLDSAGAPLCWRFRLEKADGTKDIIPLTFCRNRDSGATEWRWRDLPAPRPLFGLEMLAAVPDAPVLVVEGEKTAEAAMRLFPEWVVITWPGGARRVSSKQTDWSPLINRVGRKVLLWPDADDDGVRAMAQVAEMIEGAAVVQPDPAWTKGWDLADAEQQGWDSARALAYLESHLIEPKPKPETAERVACNISSGDLKLKCDAIWTAVQTVNNPPELLTSSAGLVLVDRDIFGLGRRRAVDIPMLRNWLTQRIAFQRNIKTEQGEIIAVATTPADMPLENLLVAGSHPLPFLTRLAEVPTFGRDGRLVAAEGFDAPSGIYYLPAPTLETIDTESSPSALEGAVALIDDLIADFPFVSETDKTHAVAFALIPIIRSAIAGRVPLFRFEAPQPRTGKSLLMRILSSLACIRVVDMPPADSDEEWRKRITASLALYPDAILFDNVTTLEFTSLKELFTADTWEDRPPHSARMVRFEVRSVFGATVNNPMITQEMMGRSLRVRLDAHLERPELGRTFRHPLIEEYARENRAALVQALLTIAVAGMNAELPADAPILGGYEAFSRRLGAIMANAGYEGFLGDRDDKSALSTDEEAFASFIEHWGAEFQMNWTTISALLPIAEDVEGLNLGRGDSNRSQQTALATMIRRHRGVTCGVWTIDTPRKARHMLYRLITTNGFVRSERSDEIDPEPNLERF